MAIYPQHDYTDDSALFIVQTTVPDTTAAKTLATAVLSEKLAACVQLSSPIESLYHWNGKLETSSEIVVTMKTLATTIAALVRAISEHHPYETPECVWFPVAATDTYRAWARQNIHV
jgi:periplasmic divalent cation tolerance protein